MAATSTLVLPYRAGKAALGAERDLTGRLLGFSSRPFPLPRRLAELLVLPDEDLLGLYGLYQSCPDESRSFRGPPTRKRKRTIPDFLGYRGNLQGGCLKISRKVQGSMSTIHHYARTKLEC